MNGLSFYLLCFLTGFIVSNAYKADEGRNEIIAAINDNGCAKPTSIEIKPVTYSVWPNWGV